MKVALKGGCWHGLKQLVSLAVLVGLLLVLLTLLMPLANDYRDVIAEKISTVIRHPLKIGHIDIRWEGLKLKPLLTFRDVEISDPETDTPILHFAEMGIWFNPWKTLLHRRLEADVVRFSGSHLKIVRSTDGKISAYGFSGRNAEKRPSLDNVLERFHGMRLELADIVVEWDDRQRDRQYRFITSDLDLYVGQDALALEANIVPPKSVGDSLEVKLVAEGPLDSPRDWNSHYFIQGREINLAGVPYLRQGVLSRAGSGTLDLKLWGSSFRDTGFDVQGSIALHDVRVEATPKAGETSTARFGFIDELAADLRLSGDFQSWRLDMNRLRVITPQKHWPEGGFSLAWDEDVSTYFGVIDYVDIESVRTIATLMPGLSDKQLEWLQTLRPVGELRGIDFSLPRSFESLEKFAFKASFDEVGWDTLDRIPGISHVSGDVLATAERGVARVDSTGLEVDFPRLFPEILDAQSLHGEISWQKMDDIWDVSMENLILANADFVARGGGSLQLGKGEAYPALTLEMIVPSMPLARVSHYIPYRVVPKKAGRWLRRAFADGQAENIRFSYGGPARKAAFKKRIATMHVDLDVRNASLDYHERWPALSSLNGRVQFDNSKLTATVSSGKVLGATITDANVLIDDLFRARLKLTGKAKGTLPQALAFVQKSPLGKNLDELLSRVTSSGPVSLDLDLLLTLSKKLKKITRSRGVIALQRCEAAIPEQQVKVTELKGQVNFDNANFSSRSLSAVFRNAPVEATVSTADDGTVLVDMEGVWAAADLLPQQRRIIEPVTSGVAVWHGGLHIPRRRPGEAKAAPWLAVTSTLSGITVDLPPPLRKEAAAQRALAVEYHFSSPPLLRASVPGLFDVEAEMQTKPRFTVKRAAVGLQGGSVSLPQQGIKVTGRWPEVDVASWADVVHRYADQPKSEDNLLDKVDDIDVTVDRFRLAAQTFEQLSLRAEKLDSEWQLALDAERVAGNVVAPLPLGRAPVRARLDRLVLQRGQDHDEGQAEFDPRVLPPLEVQSAQLRWGNLAFRDFLLNTAPRKTGMEISRLALATEYLDVDASGFWHWSPSAEQTTARFTAKGKDVGKVLKAFEFGESLGSGSGTLSGTLSWPGSPARYSLASVEADLKVDLRDGWLRKVEPGLGRLIGLLSLDYLPRRLALNFKDMEKDGFFYEKLQGSAHIESGVLETDDLLIYGPVASFELKGKTDLIQRSYDLALQVVPNLTSSAPLAAGLIAGPQAGVVVFILDKLAKGMGVDVDRSVALDYTVTGSWDAPQIVALRPEVDDAEEDGLLDFLE